MRKKKLGIALCLSATLMFGIGLNVCAGSGTYRSDKIVVGYSSSVTTISGYANTAITQGTGTASVSAQYYSHYTGSYIERPVQYKSDSNGTAVSISFSAGVGCASSYIYATHNATVNGTAIPTQTSTGSNS